MVCEMNKSIFLTLQRRRTYYGGGRLFRRNKYGNNDAVDNTDEYGYWSIPRGAVAFVVDALFMAIPVFGVAFAPIKSIAKEYGKFALKNKVREPLAN